MTPIYLDMFYIMEWYGEKLNQAAELQAYLIHFTIPNTAPHIKRSSQLNTKALLTGSTTRTVELVGHLGVSSKPLWTQPIMNGFLLDSGLHAYEIRLKQTSTAFCLAMGLGV